MLRDQLLNCGPLVPERNGWENRFMVRRPVLGAVAVFAAATGCGGRATHGGPSDAGQNVSPPGAPGTPTFIVQGPVVQVSWTAPVDDGGAAITQYVVETASTANATFRAVEHPATTSVPLNGSGKPLYVRVAAINSAGVGSPSPVAVVPLQAPVITASTTLTRGSLGGGGCATVEWTAPVFVGASDLSGYTVSVGGTAISAAAFASAKTVCGLPTHSCGTNAPLMRFAVQAQNGAGERATGAQADGFDVCDSPAQWLATAALPFPTADPVALASADHLFAASGMLGPKEGSRPLGGLSLAMASANGEVGHWQSLDAVSLGGGFTVDGSSFSDTPFDSGAIIDRGGGELDVLVGGSLNPRSLAVSNRLVRIPASTAPVEQEVLSSADRAGIAATAGRFYLLGGAAALVPVQTAFMLADPATVPFACSQNCLSETSSMPSTARGWQGVASGNFVYAQRSDDLAFFLSRVDPATGAPGTWAQTVGPGMESRFIAVGPFLYASNGTTLEVGKPAADGTVSSWSMLQSPLPFRSRWSLSGAAVGSRLFLYAVGGTWNDVAVDIVEFAEIDPASGALVP